MRLRLPLVSRARLTRATAEIDGLRHSLTQHASEARNRERDARDKTSAKHAALVASLVADYYRALAAIEDRPELRGKEHPFIYRQFGIMAHAQTMLVRLTGKDPAVVCTALDRGLPVAGESSLDGDAAERVAALTAPHRMSAAGVYAHLAPEDNGATSGLAASAHQQGPSLDLDALSGSTR